MQTFLQLIPTLAILVALTGILFSMWQFRLQQKLNFFSDYTKRYQEIMMLMPEECFEQEFNYESLPKETQDLIKKSMRLYFDLCSEEFFLFQKGRIDKEIWQEWKSGMTYMLNKPAFQL